jgi:hypothetical protein
MTCELIDYLVTATHPDFVISLLEQTSFFKGLFNICKKTSYKPLKQKIVDVFLAIAGRLKKDSLTDKIDSFSFK